MTRYKNIVLIFTAGIITSSLFTFVIPHPPLHGAEYSDIARYLSWGLGYIGSGFFRYALRPTSFVAPLYTSILGLSYFLFGEGGGNTAVLLLQILAFAMTGVLIYLINQLLFIEPAWISPVIYLLYLPIYKPVYSIWDTCFFIFVVSLTLYLYLLYFKHEKRVFLERAAIVLGGSMLLNAVSFVLLPSFLLHLLFYKRFSVPLKHYFLLAAVPLLIISPWTIRNYIVHRQFVPIRTGLGLNLYLGNNPAATGTVFLKVDGRLPKNADEGINRNIFDPMVLKIWKPRFYTEIQEDNYLLSKFKEFVVRNPRQALQLCGVKFYYFWWRNEIEKDPTPIYKIQYALLLFFTVLGMLKFRFRDPKINLFYLIFFMFSIVYTVTGPYFNWRYRFPVEPLMILLAGQGFFWLVQSVIKLNNKC